MNCCIFSGYVLDKPELKTVPSGKYVCEARINVPRDYKTPNGERLSDFLNIVGWGKIAELLAGCEKGTRINIITKVKTELYTDKNGVKRESHKYEIEHFEFAERKGSQVPQNAPAGVSGGDKEGGYIPNYTPEIADQNAVLNDSMEDITNSEELPF